MTQPTEFNFERDLRPHIRLFEHLEGFFDVVNPLYVFKKAYSAAGHRVIISMVIPAGATIFIGQTPNGNARKKISLTHCGKMRASKAYIHSITRLTWTGRGYVGDRLLTNAVSGHKSSFKYRVDTTVLPDHFSKAPYECSGGIHFFLKAQQALDY